MLNPVLAYINEIKSICEKLGLNPNDMPRPIRDESFKQKQQEWKEIVPIVRLVIQKFLQSIKGTPILMAVSDSNGVIMAIEGEQTIRKMVPQLGLEEGAHFKAEHTGTNSINAALKLQLPVQIIGEQHFYRILHPFACYSAPFKRKDEPGKILGTLSVMTSVEHAHPYLLTMLATVVDSLERELQLQRQNHKLNILNQIMMESTGHGIIITDEHGIITECNHFAEKIFCTPKTELIGRSSESLSQIGPYIQKVIHDEDSLVNVELANLYQPSTDFLFDAYPIYDKEHQLLGSFCQLRDITELKKSEEMLRQSEKLSVVGQLAAGVAHEIRNPLTTIRGFVQLMGNKYQEDHHHLNIMMSEIDRINLIISEFLILSKPHTSHFQFNQLPVILEDIVALLNTQAMLNNCEILLRYEESLPPIYCDENQIKQVFINLLKNALEAMPDGGAIQVNAYLHHEEIVIRFIDQGSGISPYIMTNLGKPFFTTKSNGTGLGLMISKKIIENHQGVLHIDSTENIGTTIEIILPIK